MDVLVTKIIGEASNITRRKMQIAPIEITDTARALLQGVGEMLVNDMPNIPMLGANKSFDRRYIELFHIFVKESIMQ